MKLNLILLFDDEELQQLLYCMEFLPFFYLFLLSIRHRSEPERTQNLQKHMSRKKQGRSFIYVGSLILVLV